MFLQAGGRQHPVQQGGTGKNCVGQYSRQGGADLRKRGGSRVRWGGGQVRIQLDFGVADRTEDAE